MDLPIGVALLPVSTETEPNNDIPVLLPCVRVLCVLTGEVIVTAGLGETALGSAGGA